MAVCFLGWFLPSWIAIGGWLCRHDATGDLGVDYGTTPRGAGRHHAVPARHTTPLCSCGHVQYDFPLHRRPPIWGTDNGHRLAAAGQVSRGPNPLNSDPTRGRVVLPEDLPTTPLYYASASVATCSDPTTRQHVGQVSATEKHITRVCSILEVTWGHCN